MSNLSSFALGSTGASTAPAAAPGTGDLVAVLLAGLSVGDPLVAGSLAVFPLAARDPLREPATRIVTIGEALERAWLTLRVTTVEDGPRVLLQSWADAAILITAGETLPGCGGLTATRDVLVPPGARGLAVPAATPAVPPGDERAWERRVRALAALAAAFPSDCDGVLLAVGDGASRVELFSSPWLLSRARPALLRAAAFESLASVERARLDPEDAERVLRDVARLAWGRRSPVGLGFEAGGGAPGLQASALFLGGALVHLSAAARPLPRLLAAPPGAVAAARP
jgi:hypothetical protein